MKVTLGALTALLLTGAVYIQPAQAQSGPQGSYLNSCRHVGMEGDRLIADCRRMDGGWERTVLDVDRCVGDIGNLNGHLTCNRAGRGDRREGYGSGRTEDWRADRQARCSGILDTYERERCWGSR